MAIPTNLEDRIQDPILLEPFKQVQRTNCKHHFSLVSAIQVFGEMKAGKCTKEALCPLCKREVHKYKPDPEFQDLVDEILKTGKDVKTTSAADNKVASDITIAAPSSTPQLKFIPGPAPKPKLEDFDPPAKSQQTVASFQEKGNQENSDEEIARQLQNEFDRQIPQVTARAISSSNIKNNGNVLGHGNIIGNVIFGNVNMGTNSQSLCHTQIPEIKIPEIKIPEINIPTMNIGTMMGGMFPFNLNLGNSFNGSTSKNSSNPAPAARSSVPLTYNLNISEKCSLPGSSSNRTVNGNTLCKINIGANSSSITIQSGVSTQVELGSFCKKIEINLNTNATASIGENSSDITVEGWINSKVILEKNCQNIKIKLNTRATAFIGDNCKDIDIIMELTSKYKLGNNCSNIKVNGGRVA